MERELILLGSKQGELQSVVSAAQLHVEAGELTYKLILIVGVLIQEVITDLYKSCCCFLLIREGFTKDLNTELAVGRICILSGVGNILLSLLDLRGRIPILIMEASILLSVSPATA